MLFIRSGCTGKINSFNNDLDCVPVFTKERLSNRAELMDHISSMLAIQGNTTAKCNPDLVCSATLVCHSDLPPQFCWVAEAER